MRLFVLPLLTLALALPVFAGDGVLEINQTCAATGCFAGDAAGFPVTISASGSYRLTGDLTPSQGSAVSITAPHVTFDLSGFELIGAGSGGLADGIFVSGENVEVTQY